jgi:uncharacterized membrane protein
MFKLEVTALDGTKAVSSIKLNLRPATPIPITDPKGVKVGLNPGSEITRTVKLTNKGLGELNGLYIQQPATLPWITAGNLTKINLLPYESATFDIVFSPYENLALGQYQDKIVVTNGSYSAVVTVAAEISTANVGNISFVVSDDTGARVPNAEGNADREGSVHLHGKRAGSDLLSNLLRPNRQRGHINTCGKASGGL